MEKKVLSETNLFFGKLPEISDVDNLKIKNFILSNILKNLNNYNFEKSLYKDIEINFFKDINWIIEYVRDTINLKYKFQLIPIKTFIQIHDKHETEIKRNHIEYPNLHNSPDYTVMYVVEGKNSEITLEHDDHRNKNKFNKIQLFNKDIVIWNSDLNYYLTPNSEEDYRILIFFNCQII
jgi:hypothetical protein